MEERNINFAVCMSGECKVADTCRRAIAYRTITKECKTYEIVNPMVVTNDDQCPMYPYKETVRYAKGFMQMVENLPPRVFSEMKRKLLAHYGKNPYYEMRKGDRLISPADQMYFQALFLQQGITTPYPFDEYIDKEEWRFERQ